MERDGYYTALLRPRGSRREWLVLGEYSDKRGGWVATIYRRYGGTEDFTVYKFYDITVPYPTKKGALDVAGIVVRRAVS